jgi:hypothetical protein
MHTPPPVSRVALPTSAGVTGVVHVERGVGGVSVSSAADAAVPLPSAPRLGAAGGRDPAFRALVDACVEVLMPQLVQAAGGAARIMARFPTAFRLPGVAAPVRLGDWLCVDRAGTEAYLAKVARKRGGVHTDDPIVAEAAAGAATAAAACGRHVCTVYHPDDYATFPRRYSVCRVADVIVLEDAEGCQYVMVVPEWYEFKRLADGSVERDSDGGMRKCGVTTQAFVLRYWRRNEWGNAPLPVHLIRRLPNVVHFCTSHCKDAVACPHAIYRGGTPVAAGLQAPVQVRSARSRGGQWK